MVDRNFIGFMHMLSAFIAGLCLSISLFFIFARFRKDDYWKKYAVPTLVTGILANVPGIILWITVFTSLTIEMDGILQRLGIVFVLIWMEVVSWKLLLAERER
jgi:SNF family Na+-dependent transporter